MKQARHFKNTLAKNTFIRCGCALFVFFVISALPVKPAEAASKQAEVASKQAEAASKKNKRVRPSTSPSKALLFRRFTIFPSLHVGSASILHDKELAGWNSTGYLMGGSIGANMTTEKLGVDVKLGWSLTRVGVSPGEGLLNTAEKLPTEVGASFGEAEIAARYRVRYPFEFGLSFLVIYGADTTFSVHEEEDDLPHAFIGLDLLSQNNRLQSKEWKNFRYGLQAFKDINVLDRNIMFIKVNVGYSFPVVAEAQPRHPERSHVIQSTAKDLKASAN